MRRSESADKANVETKPITNGVAKQRSFVRSNSSEQEKKSPPTAKKTTAKANVNNTWNGRQKTPRPSVIDAFSPPSGFARNSQTRRSIAATNYTGNGRRASQSANTSPTKGRLRQELLKTVKKNADDLAIAQEVQEILKKYGSLNLLDNDLISGPNSLRNDDDKGAYCSPRKDSRPDNHVSRIPAPISHKA